MCGMLCGEQSGVTRSVCVCGSPLLSDTIKFTSS